MVTIVTGDLFEATEAVIGHQVNCRAVMGSGVAKEVKRRYPEVFAEYTRFCQEHKADLLGSCQIVKLAGRRHSYVANLFGQKNFGSDGKKYTDDTALRRALEQLYEFAKGERVAVALPYKIGCDRGGGDWDTVLGVLQEIFTDVDMVLYQLGS